MDQGKPLERRRNRKSPNEHSPRSGGMNRKTGQAVQWAIDACSRQGGGVAYGPPGQYVSGPIWQKDNVELRLEAGATLVLSPDRADWPAGVRALVSPSMSRTGQLLATCDS